MEISVIIATYNCGHYLPQAIESVLRQTFRDWELLIVDDGSEDDTSTVIKPYLDDARVRYHRAEHRGQPHTKNLGIRLTQAPFIAFLDADDIWMPEKLERQRSLFGDNPKLGVVFSRRTVIDPDGNVVPSPEDQLYRSWILPYLFLNNFVCFSSSMVRRETLDDIGLFDENIPLAIDYDLWLRVARRWHFDYVAEPLVQYRTGHMNLSRRTTERLHIALGIMDRFLDAYGGREQLPIAVIRRGYAETYAHMGEALENESRSTALYWYLRAITTWPVSAETWRLALRAALPTWAVSLVRTIKRCKLSTMSPVCSEPYNLEHNALAHPDVESFSGREDPRIT